ncbi:Zn dependant peptidase [Propionibacterium freudenreichii]|uniref:M16 family metallopeptidase n=1 Tax=Propionibacterium freudenreichii TaxID=1744 RepID=UPI000542887A|nr:pitrilysin family protein [Propionibacterium freudenreichii]MCT3017508.1 insulinase family protein [Propionibacterium freudenreichii]CEG88641.1 Zn dependant peptidase [Propionibacterium freudenreichii]
MSYHQISRPELGIRREWQFPLPQMRTLDNGMTIWAYQLPGQYVLSMELVFDVALSDEPTGHEGVATLALRCSDEGTVAHPGNALAERIESIGAEYDGGAARWATRCGIDVAAPYADQAVDLLSEIVRTPAYEERDVERHRTLALTEIEQMRASSGSMASVGMRQALWTAGTRHALPSTGTAQSIAGLDATQVRAFHDRWWRPDGSTLILAGDLPDGLVDRTAEVFSRWPSIGSRSNAGAPRARAGGAPVRVIDRPGSVAADVSFGLVGPAHDDPQWSALQVATEAVGGAFGSRLNLSLRERLGYTYGVSASLSASRFNSAFGSSASIRNEVVAAACREALDQLDLDGHPLRDEEVSSAIDSLIAIAPLRYDTAGAIVGQAGALAARGFSPDWINQVNRGIAATTTDQANEAFDALVSRSVREHTLRMVICGDAGQLVGPLEADRFRVEPFAPIL